MAVMNIHCPSCGSQVKAVAGLEFTICRHCGAKLVRAASVDRPAAQSGWIALRNVRETIRFGAYKQDNHISDLKEPIEWIVLHKKDGKALIISKYALDCQPYHSRYMAVTWETCTLRTWLNGTFLNCAFSADEQARIQTTTVTAYENPLFDTPPGKDTSDKVFLLSLPEAALYFGSETARMCAPTAWARAQGACTNNNFTTPDGEPGCLWWLRSPGCYPYDAAFISCGGSVGTQGDRVSSGGVAVRPALWLDLEP